MTIQEYRVKLKKAHLCRDCKKQDAYTLAGRTYCYDCAEKQRIAKANARKDPVKRERMLEQHRQMQERYEQQHRCKLCGKPLEKNYTYKTCKMCRFKMAKAIKKSRYKIHGIPNLRGENGICWQCNKQPCIEGKKLCQSCYDMKLKIISRNWKSNPNHIWRGVWHK